MRPVLISLLVFAAIGTSNLRAAKKEAHDEMDRRAVVVSVVEPVYPYEARLRQITGSGIVGMRIDPATGNVTSCEMLVSTGSDILDEASVAAFRQWRFKPGGSRRAKTPVTFLLNGHTTEVFTGYSVKEKPVDDALAAFLGKGTVEKGPMPAYPRSVPWTDKHGKGIYEIHVRKDGTVGEVKILKRSGDDIFDRTAVDTLQKWHLRHGPLILELPLVFNLTPSHYSVGVPKKH